MRKKIITIDGPAGSGKSTISKALAERLQYMYLDTGALYRALAYKTLKKNIDVNDPDQLKKICMETDVTLKNIDGKMIVYVDNEDVRDKIRTENVGLAASTISSVPVVRQKLLSLQREAGASGGIIAEGRDMGSVVFPNADYKFYLDADIRERTKRRHDELVRNCGNADMSRILKDMQVRDQQDSQREIAPLKATPDSIVIDSTHLSISQVVEKILNHMQNDI